MGKEGLMDAVLANMITKAIIFFIFVSIVKSFCRIHVTRFKEIGLRFTIEELSVFVTNLI